SSTTTSTARSSAWTARCAWPPADLRALGRPENTGWPGRRGAGRKHSLPAGSSHFGEPAAVGREPALVAAAPGCRDQIFFAATFASFLTCLEVLLGSMAATSAIRLPLRTRMEEELVRVVVLPTLIVVVCSTPMRS